MKLVGLCTVGRDAELFWTTAGKPMGSVAVWFRHGRDKEFQWVDVRILGDRAEKVVPMLTKGKRIELFAGELHVERYERKGNQEKGTKLVALMDSFEFAERKEEPAASETKPPARALPGSASFDDMADDVPY